MLLDAVQVTEAKYGDAAGMDDFDTVEVKKPDVDPFETVAYASPPLQAKPRSDDFDSDLPF